MPRLTFNDYLEQRAFLRLAWEEFDQLYSLLPAHQQWQLHDYYQPLMNLSAERLRQHRANITKLEPSLPARAGRLYAKLHRVYEAGIETAERQHAAGTGQHSKTRQAPALAGKAPVHVSALARPEPDLHKLSLALIAVAEQMAREEQR